ncbi:MAG: hypothetical protein ABIE70_11285 [bacterium]
MYVQFNVGSVPHACIDGGYSVFHGVPGGAEDYADGLDLACPAVVDNAYVNLSVAWVNPSTVVIDLEVGRLEMGPSCCIIRGDTNGDGVGPDIGDLVYLVNFMFNGGPEPSCEFPPNTGLFPEVDINGSGGVPDIADLVALVNYMFNGCPECLVPCP